MVAGGNSSVVKGKKTTTGLFDFGSVLGANTAILSEASVFVADGTWLKPNNAKLVFVQVVGAGGGGGSGRKGAAGSNRRGGDGGGSGGYIQGLYLASDLPLTVPITVATGGVGAAAVTTNSTNGGNAAAATGTSAFSPSTGVALAAMNGSAGPGGSAINGTAGSSGGNVRYFHGFPWNIAGGQGGIGCNTSDVLAYTHYISGPGYNLGFFADENEFNPSIQKNGASGLTAGSPGGSGSYGGGGAGGAFGVDGVTDSGAGGDGGDGYVVIRTYTGPFDVQKFTSSGTWTKPNDARLTHVAVWLLGGGQGGSSGARGAAGTDRYGGDGGEGCYINFQINIPKDSLGATESVTVGAGGAGAAGATVDNTACVAGANGGDTSFAGHVSKGGAPLLNGITSGLTPPYGIPRSDHLHGTTSGSGGAGNTWISSIGGMGGGGYDTSNATGEGIRYGTSVVGNSSTVPAAGANAGNPAIGLFAGMCGGQGTTTTKNAGSSGYGAGGSGGGASLNGTTSGAGGNGGDGIAYIMCYQG
jgi:hypothetical protein